ncbi:hypothetical protein VPH35_091904 [Triticum aestivum]|uniref:BTB/POZ domain-containing protein At5g66560 n=1 Tax=Triticum aestivum TaxID=4565 RepID=UPI001D030A9F|nr:BTB/POZ domain-containing protein At5g66560-like [Triticum aestivum]XP_044390032.1 BTB/POZ domain-containing protein At5g66560-like [Triticum aestivum]
MSKSRKISRMLAEQDEQRLEGQRRRRSGSSEGNVEEHATAETEIEEAEEEDGDEEQQHVRIHDGKSYRITFPDFPGGPGTFEAAAKFCYGVRVELTPWNVAPLRCAAEYLEMTEEHSEDNLSARAEAYLSQSVLRHPGEATKALKSCEELLPHPRSSALSPAAWTPSPRARRRCRAPGSATWPCSLLASMASPRARHPNPRLQRPATAVRHAAGPSEAWQMTTVQESQTLRVDMDGMMSRVQGLERECSSMRRAIKKIDGGGAASQGRGSPDVAAPTGWRSRYRCKFSTQVCDSQARDAVVSTASRMGVQGVR